MIRLEKDSGLWRVTLNRPTKANSLTRKMLVQLCDIVSAAGQEASVLVLVGEGKVFSAGADLNEVKTGLATDEIWETLSDSISKLPCLTIAALNGTLAGGAFGMVLACDLRVSVKTAEFFYPVLKLGVLPQPSDPRRMAELVGPARAKMILLAGEKIDATTALNWGLVDRVVDPDRLESTVKELTQAALAANPGHLRAIKGLF